MMPWALIAGGVGALAAGAAIWTVGYRAGADNAKAECGETALQIERAANAGAAKSAAAAASAVQTAVAGIRVVNRTIRQEVEREVQTNTIYADCKHSARQLQRINAALTGESAGSTGPGAVPVGVPASGAAQ